VAAREASDGVKQSGHLSGTPFAAAINTRMAEVRWQGPPPPQQTTELTFRQAVHIQKAGG